MSVRAEHDRAVLAGLLSRDPVLHAYQLGDLDDFFWPYTSWYRRGDSVVLLYHGATPPTLLAFAGPAEVGAMAALLGELAPVLPARLQAHLSPGLESALDVAFRVTATGPHLKMALTDRTRVAAVGNVTTRPGWRGRGLGAAVMARLCGLLATEVDHVTLNVAATNSAAVRLNERLGFSRVADYGELTLVTRAG
ncbi:GNAT family N-acetyltransferase [Micromonospora sp. NPDC000442]|uniref:GNAT family N-acetyltransferase n=1 Tax=Micromonospora sp. NPDC000442 TaxID=3364217 RepID=UPI0036812447